jgi:hypothetical protein
MIIIVALSTMTTFAQTQANKNEATIKKQIVEIPVYQLFSTQNNWTFIKLDTRNGKMWQVQFGVDGENSRGERILNSIGLVSEENEVKGRFTIYPTQNFYNFLLLDQIDGDVYQVQWSTNEDYRAVVRIKSK